MTTVVVLNIALRPQQDGVLLHGYIQGDSLQRIVTCCVNVADGEALAQFKYDNPGQPVTIEVDKRWLIPVLNQEAA